MLKLCKFLVFNRPLQAGISIQNVSFASSSATMNKSYKLVIVGGGTGGCATAAKFASKLGKGKVAVIEPSDVNRCFAKLAALHTVLQHKNYSRVRIKGDPIHKSTMHYYQPMWTMVGGGMKTVKESGRPMSSVLPSKANWINQKVVEFKPEKDKVVIEDGSEISYEYLVIAIGLKLDYHKIKGLPEAFDTPGVGSNYSSLYVNKTFDALKNFKKGNAIFTFPNTPIKCAGAPQKIMYIAEDYFRKNGIRNDATVMFNTAGPALFAVKKYAEALWKVVEKRDIKVNLNHNLIEVNSDQKEAVFQLTDKENEKVTIPYEMIHVTPPMYTPDMLQNCKTLVDKAGFLEVNKDTLQHVKFPNIFGIGDCTSLPTSRTAAAVAAQVGILRKNLSETMKGGKAQSVYDGYTSCPLVTGYSNCILAEFDYNTEPLETFPFNQAKERKLMFYLKKDLMPQLYWHGLLRGIWEGPGIVRKMLHLGFSK